MHVCMVCIDVNSGNPLQQPPLGQNMFGHYREGGLCLMAIQATPMQTAWLHGAGHSEVYLQGQALWLKNVAVIQSRGV